MPPNTFTDADGDYLTISLVTTSMTPAAFSGADTVLYSMTSGNLSIDVSNSYTNLILRAVDPHGNSVDCMFDITPGANTAPAPGALVNQVWILDTASSYTFDPFTDA